MFHVEAILCTLGKPAYHVGTLGVVIYEKVGRTIAKRSERPILTKPTIMDIEHGDSKSYGLA